MAAFEAAGVPVARIPSEIPGLIAELLQRRRTRQKNGAAKKAAESNGKPVRAGARAVKAAKAPKAPKAAAARALANGRAGSARPKKKAVAAAKAGGKAANGKKKKR